MSHPCLHSWKHLATKTPDSQPLIGTTGSGNTTQARANGGSGNGLTAYSLASFNAFAAATAAPSASQASSVISGDSLVASALGGTGSSVLTFGSVGGSSFSSSGATVADDVSIVIDLNALGYNASTNHLVLGLLTGTGGGTLNAMNLGVSEYGVSVLSQSYSGLATSLNSNFNDVVDNLYTASTDGTVTLDVTFGMSATGGGGAYGINFVVGIAPGAFSSTAVDAAAAGFDTNTLAQSLFNPVTSTILYSTADSADTLNQLIGSAADAGTTDVPEPATLSVFGLAIAALGALRRRVRRVVRG